MRCNFLFFFLFFFFLCLGTFGELFGHFKKNWADENFSVLGLFFFLFVLGLTELGGLFWNPFFSNFGGQHQRDFFWTFFWHNLKFLGTIFFSLGTFKDLFGLSLKHLCHKTFLKNLLNPKHLLK